MLSQPQFQSNRFLHLAAAAITVCLCGRLLADDWPQFRGPTGDGIAQTTTAPLRWSATENVAWKQTIPGTGWSSPVIAQGKLFLTTAVSDAEGAVSLRALCLDVATGKIQWDVEVLVPDAAATKEMHAKNTLASPTPVVKDGVVYVHFGHMGTAALDLSGNVLWKQTSLNYQPRHGNGGSPVLVDNLLVLNCDAETDPFLVAIDRANGNVRWKTPRNTSATKTFSFSTPLVIEVDGAKQIISPGSGMVGAYGPDDGREIWRVTYGEGYSVVPRPVFANGLIFVASGFEKPLLLAIDPKGAKGDVTESHVKWTREKGAPLTPSVLAVQDELYFVSDTGVASCLDAVSGKVHWTKRLGGNYSASPIFAGGRVYFQSEEGVTSVLASGKEFELLASNDLEERTLASPAASDDALFIRSESQLWRIAP